MITAARRYQVRLDSALLGVRLEQVGAGRRLGPGGRVGRLVDVGGRAFVGGGVPGVQEFPPDPPVLAVAGEPFGAVDVGAGLHGDLVQVPVATPPPVRAAFGQPRPTDVAPWDRLGVIVRNTRCGQSVPIPGVCCE
ncbi:hypothetical protein ACOZ38_20955 [Sphaerisporangium viridialbum]|uniref:hypothetical protein n=1 Tax=Sphaerisporangium viridialbum TaxID=46189 RepID=UPI003C786463